MDAPPPLLGVAVEPPPPRSQAVPLTVGTAAPVLTSPSPWPRSAQWATAGLLLWRSVSWAGTRRPRCAGAAGRPTWRRMPAVWTSTAPTALSFCNCPAWVRSPRGALRNIVGRITVSRAWTSCARCAASAPLCWNGSGRSSRSGLTRLQRTRGKRSRYARAPCRSGRAQGTQTRGPGVTHRQEEGRRAGRADRRQHRRRRRIAAAAGRRPHPVGTDHSRAAAAAVSIGGRAAPRQGHRPQDAGEPAAVRESGLAIPDAYFRNRPDDATLPPLK